ncbi:MAG: hypothetical protein OFPI_10010 [Osedax symbiont Rs2]|nr:MAG: hypothetical protein OFPI_10010 [Osedax symbiont Rs2]
MAIAEFWPAVLRVVLLFCRHQPHQGLWRVFLGPVSPTPSDNKMIRKV